MHVAILTADLLAGDGPYQLEADRFVKAGPCDQCGSALTPADLLDAAPVDGLCLPCRVALLLAAELCSTP